MDSESHSTATNPSIKQLTEQDVAPREGISHRKQLNQSLNDRVRDLTETFEALEMLARAFRTQPGGEAFYRAFEDAGQVIDLGHGPGTGGSSEPESSPSSEPPDSSSSSIPSSSSSYYSSSSSLSSSSGVPSSSSIPSSSSYYSS